jgi:hypothetical protein
MYIPKLILVVSLIAIGALLMHWYQLRKRYRFAAAARMLHDIGQYLPRLSAAEVGKVCTLPTNELFEIIDSIDAVLFPRMPFPVSPLSPIQRENTLEMAFAAATSLSPRVAHILAGYSVDELCACRGGLAALYEARSTAKK